MVGPLPRALRQVFDRYCYRERYDYSATIRQSSLALASTLDLQQLLKNLFAIIRNSIRPEFLIAYLRDEDRGTFHVMLRDDEDNGDDRPTRINPDHPIVAVFAKRNSVLSRQADHLGDTRDAITALNALRAS